MKKLCIAILLAFLGVPAALAVSSLGRMELDWPDYNDPGGDPGTNVQIIQDSVTELSNHVVTRTFEFTGIADNTLNTIRHNFGLNSADLQILVYSGTGNSKTLINAASEGYIIADNGALPKEEIDITTPVVGGPHTFTVVLSWPGGQASGGGGSSVVTGTAIGPISQGALVIGSDAGGGNLNFTTLSSKGFHVQEMGASSEALLNGSDIETFVNDIYVDTYDYFIRTFKDSTSHYYYLYRLQVGSNGKPEEVTIQAPQVIRAASTNSKIVACFNPTDNKVLFGSSDSGQQLRLYAADANVNSLTLFAPYNWVSGFGNVEVACAYDSIDNKFVAGWANANLHLNVIDVVGPSIIVAGPDLDVVASSTPENLNITTMSSPDIVAVIYGIPASDGIVKRSCLSNSLDVTSCNPEVVNFGTAFKSPYARTISKNGTLTYATVVDRFSPFNDGYINITQWSSGGPVDVTDAALSIRGDRNGMGVLYNPSKDILMVTIQDKLLSLNKSNGALLAIKDIGLGYLSTNTSIASHSLAKHPNLEIFNVYRGNGVGISVAPVLGLLSDYYDASDSDILGVANFSVNNAENIDVTLNYSITPDVTLSGIPGTKAYLDILGNISTLPRVGNQIGTFITDKTIHLDLKKEENFKILPVIETLEKGDFVTTEDSSGTKVIKRAIGSFEGNVHSDSYILEPFPVDTAIPGELALAFGGEAGQYALLYLNPDDGNHVYGLVIDAKINEGYPIYSKGFPVLSVPALAMCAVYNPVDNITVLAYADDDAADILKIATLEVSRNSIVVKDTATTTLTVTSKISCDYNSKLGKTIFFTHDDTTNATKLFAVDTTDHLVTLGSAQTVRAATAAVYGGLTYSEVHDSVLTVSNNSGPAVYDLYRMVDLNTWTFLDDDNSLVDNYTYMGLEEDKTNLGILHVYRNTSTLNYNYGRSINVSSDTIVIGAETLITTSGMNQNPILNYNTHDGAIIGYTSSVFLKKFETNPTTFSIVDIGQVDFSGTQNAVASKIDDQRTVGCITRVSSLSVGFFDILCFYGGGSTYAKDPSSYLGMYIGDGAVLGSLDGVTLLNGGITDSITGTAGTPKWVRSTTGKLSNFGSSFTAGSFIDDDMFKLSIDVAEKGYVSVTNTQTTIIQADSLSDLSDVDPGLAPADGEILTYNNANSRWEAAAPSGGGGSDGTYTPTVTCSSNCDSIIFSSDSMYTKTGVTVDVMGRVLVDATNTNQETAFVYTIPPGESYSGDIHGLVTCRDLKASGICQQNGASDTLCIFNSPNNTSTDCRVHFRFRSSL